MPVKHLYFWSQPSNLYIFQLEVYVEVSCTFNRRHESGITFVGLLTLTPILLCCFCHKVSHTQLPLRLLWVTFLLRQSGQTLMFWFGITLDLIDFDVIVLQTLSFRNCRDFKFWQVGYGSNLDKPCARMVVPLSSGIHRCMNQIEIHVSQVAWELQR